MEQSYEENGTEQSYNDLEIYDTACGILINLSQTVMIGIDEAPGVDICSLCNKNVSCNKNVPN